MPADVGEGVERAVRVAADDDRLADDVHGHVVAGVRELFDACHDEPVAHEELLDLHRVDLGRGVVNAGQMPCVLEPGPRRLELLLVEISRAAVLD